MEPEADPRPLDAVIARLRKLSAVSAEIAEAAAPEILAEAKKTAAAGTTAEGTAWAPGKNGGRVLKNAAGAISVVVSGLTEAVITLVLKGPEVFHHFGTGKVPSRPILFDRNKGVPKAYVAILQKHATRVIAKFVGGST